MQKPVQKSRSPVHVFAVFAAVGFVVFLLCCAAFFGISEETLPALFAGGLFYGGAAVFTGRALARYYPHPVLGLCNLVTALRLLMVAVLVVATFAGVGPSWALFGFACLTLVLDGVDGWLARHQDLTSDFGARFDMEVDAIFALVLAIFAASTGAAGWLIICLGLPHYVFSFAKLGLPWLDQTLPDLFSRKAVCVLQLGTLIVLQMPGVPSTVATLLVLLAVGALFWSFGRDILWLKSRAN